ncbi:MAG: hypothetical protein JRJ39_06480 [Deltaproteobacteria bacterium]|nr:hypothetical protein [Deltaproteobacteria bacterium]
MEVKGGAVSSVPEFVRTKFGSRYEEWLDSLSEDSNKIMKEHIIPAISWYPIRPGLIEPTQKICELFYDNDENGAWEAGRFSADIGLIGVYKMFVKLGSPKFIVGRAATIFSSYYKPCRMEIAGEAEKMVVLHIKKFLELERLVELRICGWIERALEISGSKAVKVELTKSLTNQDQVTEIVVEWK